MLENYLKISIKVLLRKKFFTFISLFGISFTILVLLIAASVLEHAFNPGGPQVHDDRTLIAARMLGRDSVKTSVWHSSPGYGFSSRYAKKLITPEVVSIVTGQKSYFTYVNGNKLSLSYKYTDSEFWDIFKFNFTYGKPFTKEENETAQKVVVLSESAADKYFGKFDVIGELIDISGKFYKVIGVVKDISLANEILVADMWIPIKTNLNLGNKFFGSTNIIVLAKSSEDFHDIKNEFLKLTKEALSDPHFDKSLHELQCELKTPFQRLLDKFTFKKDEFNENSTNADTIEKKSAASGFLLFGSLLGALVLVFMLLPSINLVNINLSRMIERNSEIGVRKAFGASSNVLVGQFITENIILTFIGAVISLGLSFIVIQIVNNSEALPNLDLSVNIPVFVSGVIVCLVFGVLSGVYPAYKMSRTHPVEALRGGEK